MTSRKRVTPALQSGSPARAIATGVAAVIVLTACHSGDDDVIQCRFVLFNETRELSIGGAAMERPERTRHDKR